MFIQFSYSRVTPFFSDWTYPNAIKVCISLRFDKVLFWGNSAPREDTRMANGSFGRDLVETLGVWVNQLARPLMPPRMVAEADAIRLEFREHIPHTVMIGKAVRAVSGIIRAALILADLGYVTECAALLRIVSDFCTEVTAIGEALNSGSDLPIAVQTFIEQYFARKARTPQEFAEQERCRYVSREELMKAEVRMAQRVNVDGEQVRAIRRFVNMTYDAYVHGAYETTMELCDPMTGTFMFGGHPEIWKREEFVEAVFLKLHEVVRAIELTAAVTSHAVVFGAAREARRTMDTLEPWKRP
jgi:hypothetical protein